MSNIQIIIFSLLLIVLGCAILWCHRLPKSKRKRRVSVVLRLGIAVYLIAYVLSVYGSFHQNFETPEESLQTQHSLKTGDRVLYKIQGENLCCFILKNDDNGGIPYEYFFPKVEGKWQTMSMKEETLLGVCSGVDVNLMVSSRCNESIIVINMIGLATEKLHISDCLHTNFQTQLIEQRDKTTFEQYYAIIPTITNDYFVEINGERYYPLQKD